LRLAFVAILHYPPSEIIDMIMIDCTENYKATIGCMKKNNLTLSNSNNYETFGFQSKVKRIKKKIWQSCPRQTKNYYNFRSC